MKQYWIKNRYEDGFERWELTKGKFSNKDAARKAYEARAKALHLTIVEVKPHEQFEFHYDKEPATGCDYGIGG